MDSLTTRFTKDVFVPYCDLLKAQYKFHPKFSHVKKMWENKLNEEELINGPYLEKSQTYASGKQLNDLKLHENTCKIINKKLKGRTLWKHQTDALEVLLAKKNSVIATGTSSGKTLCYQIPIIDDLIRNPSPGLRAIIIYPLNALVNDQLKEWEELLKNEKRITFARFTGQTPNSQKDYENRLKDTLREQLANQQLSEQEKQRKITNKMEEKLEVDRIDCPNKLNHREAIRKSPPNILITNFSMLEYLLERPVDAPIFENSQLKFLVLDEVHAYRGIQSTEIAFLIRRLKDRLGTKEITCIATSATLGKQDDAESMRKVCRFASDLFGEEFLEPNPIYGTTARPRLEKPSFRPRPINYIRAAESLRKDEQADIGHYLDMNISHDSLASLMSHDENLYHLRNEILAKPTLLSEAAKKLWHDDSFSLDGLQSLLEIVAVAKKDGSHEDLLPTRLHYFVRAQDGLHVCLHKQCPGRFYGRPAFFVSKKSEKNIPEGYCPDCYRVGQRSKLVEVVSCRKCGYLFGALQDLGPRRAQKIEKDDVESIKPNFDSFSTELGWAADSFWSYFSVDDDLPYPDQPTYEEDDPDDLFLHPDELKWCAICGKKKDEGAGDNCRCPDPHIRNIKVFHRQCCNTGKAKEYDNLKNTEKTLLNRCPNCGARNVVGLEPLRRFQESDDETGLAIAIPLAHFQVTLHSGTNPTRKLLCFTDHRQRAAAFPSLLEEETFEKDMGKTIVRMINQTPKPIDIKTLGENLADLADPMSENNDPDFFLPVSRFPDEDLSAKDKRNLWIAETLSYFGIPDSARESAEDLGLVNVSYIIKKDQEEEFHRLLNPYSLSVQETNDLLQVLLGLMRQRKAFTIPKGINPDAPAFGKVTADIGYTLRRDNIKKSIGWLPYRYREGSSRDNVITDYIRKVLCLHKNEAIDISENIWNFLISQILIEGKKGIWQIDHERIFIEKAKSRYICNRCRNITTYSIHQCCTKKGCDGKLESHPFIAEDENIISRWIAGEGQLQFKSLKSEEHTAQINKDLAKQIEDDFRNPGGVNLLSSTTTFELGINIGDLQKVLLRNAPPSSANYVQRVGRAGRGEDKNSICVTLCRRTKYDADAWADPLRLMSGEIRSPTVFIGNKIVSQRHLNAIAFSEFLRSEFLDRRVLGEVTQKIRLDLFLTEDMKSGFGKSRVYLDFTKWLIQRDLLNGFDKKLASSGWPMSFDPSLGIKKTSTDYEEVLSKICDELNALVEERKKLYDQKKDNTFYYQEINRSIERLLDADILTVLSKRGFLPRYAFPLDVVSLETGWTRWSRDADVELNRDRGIAIAEFAPGAQVIAHKKVFTSAGLYIVSRSDEPKRYWYAKCPGCGQIRTAPIQDKLKGLCKVCGRSVSQYIKSYVEPSSFSIRIDKRYEASARHRRSTLIRQRQALTHFIDIVPDEAFKNCGLFDIAIMNEGKLFRYNLGPGNQGFMLCPYCGCSESARGFKLDKKHKRLRPLAGTMECNGHFFPRPLAYGHEYESVCLVARPTLPPESEATVKSLSFALQKGLCSLLNIDTYDIGVSWRWLDDKGKDTTNVEIILYDTAPGGAGFAKEGYENWPQVVEKAIAVCEECSCESACYDCLKNYSNQSHHEDLKRNLVVDFIGTQLKSNKNI